jgi:hypothetical protein
LLMVYWGRHSDLKLERRWHYMILWVIRAIALVVSTMISDAFWVSMALITVATVGSVAPLPIFWAIRTSFLSAFAAAAGIAIITSLGNMAGFLSPYILGLIKSSTGSLTIGICLTAAVVILGALSVLAAIPGSGCRGTSGTALRG